MTTDIARSGQRQVPFLNHTLVTVTDIRLTSRKFVVNFFPMAMVSNPGPSAPDPDALTTRPQCINEYHTKIDKSTLHIVSGNLLLPCIIIRKYTQMCYCNLPTQMMEEFFHKTSSHSDNKTNVGHLNTSLAVK